MTTIIILYYAIWGSTRVKNTKYKYTIKTFKNRELQNRQRENTTAINTEKQKSVMNVVVLAVVPFENTTPINQKGAK